MKKFFYWGPFIDNEIATVKSIYNSAYGLKKYFNIHDVKIINSIGEWNFKKKDKHENLYLNTNFNYAKKLPKNGYFKSRVSFIIIFFTCFFQIKNILKKHKPDYFIAHLLVSLPMLLFKLFNFDSKLIIRVSGKPKLNILRKKFWQFTSNNVYKIFCPTEETKNFLIKNNIYKKDRIFVLRDPVLNLKTLRQKKDKKNFQEQFQKENIILVGRLTKQKNFNLIIEVFKKNKFLQEKYKIFIFGDGELKDTLAKEIKKKELNNKIFLMGHVENIYKYMKNSKLFILTSLWEDPGFVLIEAAFCNLSIIASDCPSGPSEILSKNKLGGYLFKNNDVNDLNDKIDEFFMEKDEILNQQKLYCKKKTKDFTIYNHVKKLNEILEENIS
jgi:glycosyltransferase involved in cell wall biosynthesis